MGSSSSVTNDTKGPVQGNVRHTRQDINVNPTRQEIKVNPTQQDIKVKPTRTSQLRGKSPLQRPSSSLSISSKASFSPYSILPPVTSRDETIVERPTSGSKNMKTSTNTQGHDERSVYVPDTRNPLPDIRNTSMSNAGSSDKMKTTHKRSNNHGRLSLQPLDSLRRMRKNDSRRHHRNRNGGDFTQSGYNQSDLEIAVQASLAISEEQQSYGGEDNHSEHSLSELDIRTSKISERSSLQTLDSLRRMRKNGPRRHHRNRNGGDFTQSGYNQSDLEIAVQASLAISEEQQGYVGEDNHSEHSLSELDIQTSKISERNEDLTESGYNNRDLDIARQMSLAISEELHYQQPEDEGMQEEEEVEDSSQRNEDLTESGYNNRDLDIALQMSLAISEELQHEQQEDKGLEQEDIAEKYYQQQEDESMEEEEEAEEDEAEEEDSGERHDYGCMFTKSGYEEEELKRSNETSLAASLEDKGRDWMRSGYDQLKTENVSTETAIGVNQSNDDPSDKKHLDEENGSGDSSKSDKEEEGRNIINEEKDPSDLLDEESMANKDEEEQEEKTDDENEEEGMENCDPDISMPIEEILSEMRANFYYSGYITLCIKRSRVWESSLEQFRQEDFSPMCEFSVKFVDDEGNEEGAIDAGGPKREYFQLVMDHLANCSLFEGPSGRKLLSYDVQANKRKEYFYAGMVIGHSLVYGGPVPRFLSPLLLDCLILGPENVTGSREDIYDSDWLQLLDEVQTTDCVRDFVLNHNKTLYITGCLRNEKTDNKDQLIQDLINYYLVERTRPAFDNFKQGLHAVGVLDYILKYPDQFRELFSKQEPLTAEKMSSIFTINKSYTYFQEEDDNDDEERENRENNDSNVVADVERKTTEFWETYLRIVEAGDSEITLEDILMFATGMKEQPYGQYPKIYFHHDGETGSKYPTSSTCSCCLYLPLHETFEEFKEAMDFGILHGSQFGQI